MNIFTRLQFLLFFFCGFLSISTAQDLLKTERGYPVIVHADTLFHVKNKLGALSAAERAQRTTDKIKALDDDLFFIADSLLTVPDSLVFDIVYKGNILLSISKPDADSMQVTPDVLAATYQQLILQHVKKYKSETDFAELLKRGAMGTLILLVLVLCIYYMNRYFNRFTAWILLKFKKRAGRIKIKDYDLINKDTEVMLIKKALGIFKYFLFFLLIYLTLPLIFRLFPWTKPWGDNLINFIVNPLKNIISSIVDFIPNLITIIVIYIVFHYVKKVIRFLANEIEADKLKINGFYADWAKPTYNIVRLVLNAFMIVVIWPFIPGSNSDIFKGVSVFLGLIISFGSSSAISNGVAGMVITYMRPFKIGDVVRIGEIQGTVLEKSLLVTRLQTTKNEIITIPNSAILNGNTINYTSLCRDDGLIIHTTISIGYDIGWQKIHELLIAAALKTEGISSDRMPFVLQTSLDDWYVSYQINAYTNSPERMAPIYSELHKNIHEAFDGAGIEMMSPHYQAIRDGNASTIRGEKQDDIEK
ncbi:mechanosensitive ion channel family protein [Sphingobacterium spiritivorum]|uniref:mechanosensitive ion channel family protein n=1 Tax=Sphingobacterium spiritivorum TaxID=258 RepID=UPI003DA50D17